MKINKLWGRACLIASLLISSHQVQGAFIDSRLESWLSEPVSSQQALDDQKEIVIFLKARPFQDRSQPNLAQAIDTESHFVRAYLREKAAEMIQLVVDAKQRPEYLWSSNAVVLKADREGLKKLAKLPLVDALLSNYTIQLDDSEKTANNEDDPIKTDESKYTYGLQVVKAPQAWEQGITGEGVVIGVVDSGVDETHPDLVGKVLLKKDFSEDADNIDGNGHGTHVCGTIAGGNASGSAIGVAPGAKLIVAKGLSAKGSGSLAGLLKAMEFMLDPDGNPTTQDAPRLVSNSWGASTQFIYGFKNIIKTWRRFGIVPNFAAGNSGPTPFSANSPGSYPFSLAVGAVDENLNATSFSSRGPVVWWKVAFPIFVKKPDVAAPGFKVKSSLPGGSYARYSGTSMATPHMAGVAALAFQANPKLSVDGLLDILKSTGLDRGKKGKDNVYGYGIIQADKIIEKARAWQANSASYFQDKDPSQWEWDTP